VVIERDGRARRNRLAALAVAAMVLVGGLALSSEGDDAPPPDAGEPGPSSTVATASPVPTTALVGEATGPVFGAPVGALVLLGGTEAAWRLLDPDTGVVRTVEELSGLAPDEVVPVRGGVLVRADGIAIREGADGNETRTAVESLAFIELPSGETRQLDLTHLGDVPQILDVVPSGDPDRVWVLYPTVGAVHASLIGLDGRAVLPGFDVSGSVRGGTTTGLAVSAGGDAFLATGQDTASRLGDGDVVAATADKVALLACDDEIECSVSVVTITSGQTRRGLPISGAADGSFFVSISPDGWLASIPQRVGSSLRGFTGGGASVVLSVTSPTGTTSSIDLGAVSAEPVWLPNGLGLLVIANGAVLRVSEAAGSLIAEPVRSLRPGDDDTVMVLPG
jgi:hypothetical protein